MSLRSGIFKIDAPQAYRKYSIFNRKYSFLERIQEKSPNIIDGFVKSLKTSFNVIPVKAGIQYFQMVLDACLRRHDGVSDFLRVCHH
jgi:hypothetical protein